MNISKIVSSRILLSLGLCFLIPSCLRIAPPGDTPVHPANPNSPYADVLKSCGYATSTNNTCSVGTLPYLGQDTMKPTVQDILNRTLVSEDWMGDHFRDFLMVMPDNLLLLFRSTTCIVVTKDVYYKSYYQPATACIVIDANAIWLTQDEKQSLELNPYVPSKGIDQLQFFAAFRAVKNNQLLFQRRPYAEITQNRTLDDIKYLLAYNLYHELGHAAAFVPIALFPQISPDQKPNDIFQNQTNDLFGKNFPLASSMFKDLIPAFWHDHDASGGQKDIDPEQAVDGFSSDTAVQPYNYTNEGEDLAESFAHFMMFYNFGVEFDVAIIPGTASNSDWNHQLIAWGQRRRVASPLLRDKITFAVQTLIPDWAATVNFNKLGSSANLTPGKSWQDNLIH